ncbi:hypothetical protein F5Y01DRAFT_167068 [Xylaria sp. FL0043]|nr:hypothetical protein F5Y01DRAFT_167068 [Xylaria sp. FL0043]
MIFFTAGMAVVCTDAELTTFPNPEHQVGAEAVRRALSILPTNSPVKLTLTISCQQEIIRMFHYIPEACHILLETSENTNRCVQRILEPCSLGATFKL